MRKLLFIMGLIVAGGLAYYVVSNKSVDIQNDIKTRLAQDFAAQNVSGNIQTEVSGRDVTLTGAVSEEQAKLQAGKLASELVGVRAVDNEIQVVEPPPIMAEPAADTQEAPVFDWGALPVEESAVVANETLETEEAPATDEAPVVEPTVVEEAPVVVPEEVDLDKPLAIKHRKIVRRDVDSITASKTVEAACEKSLTSLLDGQKINFDSGKATIQHKSHNLLDRMVVAAKNCHEDTIITINGYTDDTGDMQANRQLSLDRARAVGRYMLKRGVAKQVKVVGHGPNDPIADNDTEEGRAKNRRIEFKVFKAKAQE